MKGNISRQEAVSMLPPLFLDVLPHHKVYLPTFLVFLDVINVPPGHGHVRSTGIKSRCFRL